MQYFNLGFHDAKDSVYSTVMLFLCVRDSLTGEQRHDRPGGGMYYSEGTQISSDDEEKELTRMGGYSECLHSLPINSKTPKP